MSQHPKRIAVLRLHLPNGSILTRQVLTLANNGDVLSYEPLTHELAFVEWQPKDWTLKGPLQ
ncbi:MAG: hypothetical protein Q4A44_03095 [Bacteroidales bacterium]|nr:hypothetical protein [Bacteroidales bacterium]